MKIASAQPALPYNNQMTELTAWIIAAGLVIAIVGIYIVSVRMEKHMRDTTHMMIHGYDSIMAHLRRLSGKQVADSEPVIGVILERRHRQRRAHAVPMSERAASGERRRSLGRRREDLVVVK